MNHCKGITWIIDGQNMLLPILQGQEEQTLFIIGNGIDLYHNLKSSYCDFHRWLMQYRYGDFVEYMETMFPTLKDGKPLLWQDFEEALGKGEPLKIHNDFFQGVDDGNYDEDIQDRVVERIKPTLDKIPKLLREWANTLPVADVQYRKELKPTINYRSLYLSFNYTMLLERVYGIPAERVLHVHHSLDDGKKLIIGHRFYYSEDDIFDANYNKEVSVIKIVKELNALNKPVESIINEHKSFFDKLGDIKNVIVFGFSISSIDRLYFEEVLHRVHDNAHWFFICKTTEVKQHYEGLVDYYNKSFQTAIGNEKYRQKMTKEHCQYILIDE